MTSFVINGKPYLVNLATLPADITLNTFIREHAQLTATKFMCLEGGCGACVCVIKGRHPFTKAMRTWAANSCLTLLNTCADWEIITSEGIGNKGIGYHPIQKRLAKMNGSQCGFCSPGFVMNMYGLLESKSGKVTMEEVENSFGGNICRCTGYRPILDAMKSFASDSNISVPPECQDIEDLNEKTCPKTGLSCAGTCRKPVTSMVHADGRQWHWPKDRSELAATLGKVGGEGEYMLVAGNTAHGVYRRSVGIKDFIDLNAMRDLKWHQIGNDKLYLGGGLSLSEAMDIFLEAAKEPGFEYCQQLWEHFDLIANVPVRNTGTLAGNICTKKKHKGFYSDVFITFEALNVEVEVVIAYKDFPWIRYQTYSLSDYLKSSLKKSFVAQFQLKAYPKDKFVFQSYKIMPRAQNASAYVNAGFLLELNRSSGIVASARICFGGIRPDFTHATSTESLLVGQNLMEMNTITKIFSELSTSLRPDDVLPSASAEYRQKLACGLFYKFLLSIRASKVTTHLSSGGQILRRALSSGAQTFETIQEHYPITQTVQKLEALIQTAGEATYMNDTLTLATSVYCVFVNATRVGATVEQIDPSQALSTPGVVAFFSAKDIPGTNTFVAAQFNYEKEEIFVQDRVRYFDQPLGIIVASTKDIADRAASKVKVTYSHDSNVVHPTLMDVNIASHLLDKSPLESSECVDESAIGASGMLDLGPQYHFTMEPQTTIAVPFEEGLQVWSATQWMDHTQCVIANMLKIRVNDVQLRVRRLGGGYGAKITRGNQVACAASLAAFKLNRPVRFVQSIESMMSCNGKRWSCHSEYEFQAKASGQIVRLKNHFIEDAGCTLNEKAVLHVTRNTFENCYQFVENSLNYSGKIMRTDAVSGAWCRAPGSVEGIAMIENIMEHIAFEAKIDPADVRLANMAPGNKMEELLPRFLATTEYRQRRQQIADFNAQNRWIKRGLGLAVMQFPINYFTPYAATVAIYHCDGTVVISHGGIEMGQGINTKVAQVAAHILAIPLELVKIESSDTINGANSFFTGASIVSESVGFAVRKACQTLNDRLRPIKASLEANAPWQEIVQTAWKKSVNLIVSDQFQKGDIEPYNVYGLALTEVEVDILTGSHQISRVDILEDAGESINPALDVGQIEGAFVMGLGYFLTEKLVYDRQTGELLTNRTWNYKPMGARDIPIDFRIEILQKSPNAAGFLRSKATGEPPLCLAVSVIFAIQQAIQSARTDAGSKRAWVRLGAPTTPETVVLNAGTDVKTFTLDYVYHS